VVNAYLLAFGGFLLLGGRCADVLGRRRMFLLGVAAFATFSALCGVSQSSGLLVGARGLQGVSAALLSPAALAILMVTFRDGRDRTRALGVWAGLMGLGAAVGLAAGGVITSTLGWRWVFVMNVPIGAVVLLAAVRLLPADRARDRRTGLDASSAVLATAGLLAVVFSVVEAPDHGWGSIRTLGGLAGGAALLAVLAAHERRARQPLVPAAVVRRRSVAIANAAMLVLAGGMFAMFFFVSLYMQVVQGWSPLRAGVSGLAFSLAFAAVSSLATRLVARVPARVLVAAGASVAALGLLLMTRLEPGSSYAGALLPALLVSAAGMGLAFVPLATTATSGVPERDAGVVSALLTTSQHVGGAIGIAVLVTIASNHTAALVAAGTPQPDALTAGFHVAFAVDAALLLGAALLAPLLGRIETVA
jgi:EmrB/QacA subfamily drug resistance transporter